MTVSFILKGHFLSVFDSTCVAQNYILSLKFDVLTKENSRVPREA